jgi:hypothetical protein
MFRSKTEIYGGATDAVPCVEVVVVSTGITGLVAAFLLARGGHRESRSAARRPTGFAGPERAELNGLTSALMINLGRARPVSLLGRASKRV